jgi:hypothetical protein
MITKITPQVCDLLRTEMVAAVAAIAAKHGISITPGRGTYSASNFTMKVEFAVKTEDGLTLSREATAYQQMCRYDGLLPEDLGREFVYGGRPIKIVGYMTKARRSPYLFQEVRTGKRFRAEAEGLVAALNAARPGETSKKPPTIIDVAPPAPAKRPSLIQR